MNKPIYFFGLTLLTVWTVALTASGMGVTVPQALAGIGDTSPLYPLANLIHKLWYGIFGTGEIQIRLLGLVTLILVLLTVYKALAYKFEEANRWILWLTICTLPGMLILGTNHVPEAWSLLGFGLYLQKPSPTLKKAGAILILATSSFVGLLGAAALLIFELFQKKIWALGMLVLLSLWCVVNLPVVKTELQTNFVRSLSMNRLGEISDAEQKDIYLGSQNATPQFRLLQRVVFNKPVRAMDTVIKRFVEIIDLTMWTAPIPAWVITGLSGIPTKAIWPIAYFWQIPLVVVGFVSGLSSPVFAITLLPLMILDSSLVNSASALLLLPLAYLTAKSAEKLISRSGRAGKIILAFGFVISFGLWTKSSFVVTENQKLDLLAYRGISRIYTNVKNQYPVIFVTNRLGPTETMLKFYEGELTAMTTVDAFDWTFQTPTPGVYIGFTREFTGADNPEVIETGQYGRVVGRTTLPGEVVYKYGKDIWAIEK